jgi:hypothetical protein
MISSVTVSDSSPAVLLPAPSDVPYRFVAIGNLGPSTVYLKFTADADALTPLNGIPLPAGSSLLCDQDSERDIFKIAVQGITATGSSTVSVQAY